MDGRALGGEAVQRVVEPDGCGAFAGGVLFSQARVVDFDQPRFGPGFAQPQGERVALRVDGFDDRGLAVLDPFGPRVAGLGREGVGGVADCDHVAGPEEIFAVDRSYRALTELAGVEPLLLGELVDEIDIRVRAMDDERRPGRADSAPPPVPLLDHAGHRLRPGVMKTQGVVLLEDRDRIEAVACYPTRGP